MLHAGLGSISYLWGDEAKFCNNFAPFIGNQNIEYLIGEIEQVRRQIRSTVMGGKHLGLRTLIVPPIRDKRSLFVRAKRRIERPYIRKYWKIHPKED
jgi:predicted HAD superfamily phosphohydrolase YqeG